MTPKNSRRIVVSGGIVALAVAVFVFAGMLSRVADPPAPDTSAQTESLTEVAGQPVEDVSVGDREVKAASDRLVIRLENLEASAQFGDKLTETSIPDTYLLAVDGDVNTERVRVAKLPGVVAASPDYVVTATKTPNDPQYASTQWNLPKISAPTAWNRTTGSGSMLVANIDTGVNRNHQDLTAKMWTNPGEVAGNGVDDDGNGYIDDSNGMDFVHATKPGGVWKNDANGPADDHGHGTLTSSVTAAATNNGVGIAGADWGGKIVAIKVLDAGGSGFFSDVAEGIRYAAVVGADVANMSLGAFGVSSDFYTDSQISFAVGQGTVLVAASGNDGSSSVVDYPAKNSNVIAVGATTSSDAKAGYSNGGAELDLVAPGSGIRGAGLNNTSYTYASGTSLSTPHVTGVVGLLRTLDTTLTPSEVRTILRKGVDKVVGMGGANRTNLYGYGRLNANKVLDQVKPYSAAWAGQSSSATIASGEDRNVYMDFENTGTQPWSSTGSHPIRLGTSHPRDHASPFYNSSWLSKNRVTTFSGRVEDDDSVTSTDTINPGETARFEFTMTSPPSSSTSTKTIKSYFQPVVEGVSWLQDQSTYISTSIPYRFYRGKVVAKTNPPAVVQPGEVNGISVDVKNIGTATWRKDTRYNLNLGTIQPKNHYSSWYTNTWQTKNRLSTFVGKVDGGSVTPTNAIAPGETARWTFNVKAPTKGGKSTEHFSSAVENYGWQADIGLSWSQTVPSSAYAFSYVSKSSHNVTMTRGESATVSIRFRNVGYSTWQSNGSRPFRLGTDRPRDRGSGFADGGNADGWLGKNRIKLTRNLTDAGKNVGGETSVAPGEIGEFEFEVVGNPKPGAYREHFRVVVDGYGWLKDIGINWIMRVEEPIDVALTSQSSATMQSTNVATIRDVNGNVRGTVAPAVNFTLRWTGSSYQAVLPSGTVTSCCALTAEQGALDRYTVTNLADGGGNNRFRGSLSIRHGSAGTHLVNSIDLEQYLRGLAEVPDSWPLEAIKAQVVAARTYAGRKIQAPKASTFDLYDDTRDQVYNGYNREITQPNHVTAGNATKGVVIKQNGSLIQAFYSSDSGGHTASNEESWGGSPISYLRGKSDPYQKPDVWSKTVSNATLRSNYGFGHNIDSINVLAFYPSGRVKTVRLNSSDGASQTYTLTADTHRSRMTLRSSRVTGIGRSGNDWVFNGRGFGHGIGMGQWGAYNQALASRSAAQILSFYYTGITLGQF